MTIRVRLLAAVGASIAVIGIPLAYAAGLFPGLPIVGGSAYCTGFSSFQQTPTTPGVTQSPTQCNSTAPAGPVGLTGSELIPADTGLAGGAAPQTVLIPSALLTTTTLNGSMTNRLIGGDMTTNPAQRLSTTKGIASLATLSPTAAVITADRWWVIAPAAGVTVTMDSTAATAVIPGFNNTKALRLARTTSGAAGIMCVGQTLDQAAAAPLIGNNAVFSFWLSEGAGMSATAGNFTVNVDYYTAADTAATQATLGFAGGNGSLAALGDVGLISAGPTNFTRAIAGFSPGTTGTVAAGVATIQGSTTWTRYSVYAPIPVNAPGTTTPVTGVSVSICFAPAATTAITTDWIEVNGMQLEAKPSTVTPNQPAGVISPSAFERRPAQVEAALAYYYWIYNFESQTLVSTVASCADVSVTVANCYYVFPVPMRLAPVMKFTTGFQLFTTTAYTTLGACTTLSASASLATVPSTVGALINCTAGTVPAAGTANQLMTLGTASATGIIVASAEP
jgi:hypothetical protein